MQQKNKESISSLKVSVSGFKSKTFFFIGEKKNEVRQEKERE